MKNVAVTWRGGGLEADNRRKVGGTNTGMKKLTGGVIPSPVFDGKKKKAGKKLKKELWPRGANREGFGRQVKPIPYQGQNKYGRVHQF